MLAYQYDDRQRARPGNSIRQCMLASLVFLGLQLSSPQTTLSSEQVQAIEKIVEPWNSPTKPGGVVGIYKDGQIVWQGGFGLADLEQGTKLTPDSMMDIGSISKQFVAAAILRLQLEGKLNTNDSVRKHLPELPEFMEKIKLHHLIHHTSGLRDYLNMNLLSTGGLDDLPTTAEMLQTMSRQRELNFEPGTASMYCNTGYAMLAEIVERTEKTDLTTAVKRLVWTPLGMTDSLFDETKDLVVAGRANSFIASPTGYTAPRWRAEIVGDGGVLTTVEDMGKWAAFLNSPKPEHKEWRDLMLEPSKTPFGPTMRYAAGLFLDQLQGVRRIQHGGDWSGFHAQFCLYPESGWAIFTSGNDGTQLSKQFNDRIARVLLGLTDPAANTAPTPPPSEPLTEETAKPFVGRFVLTAINMPVTFRYQDGKLFAEPEGQGSLPLERTGEREFSFAAAQAVFAFAEPVEGVSPRVVLRQGGGNFAGPRQDAFKATDEQIERWVGTYHSEELGYDIVLGREGEQISVTINGNPWGNGTLTSEKKLTAGGFVTIEPEGDASPFGALRIDAGGRASRLLFTRKD